MGRWWEVFVDLHGDYESPPSDLRRATRLVVAREFGCPLLLALGFSGAAFTKDVSPVLFLASIGLVFVAALLLIVLSVAAGRYSRKFTWGMVGRRLLHDVPIILFAGGLLVFGQWLIAVTIAAAYTLVMLPIASVLHLRAGGGLTANTSTAR